MIDVILPALDEAEAIPGVLARHAARLRGRSSWTTGPPMRSADVARACGARVVAEPRRGFGAACYAGLRAAESEVVCFMDCDGSLDPGQLHRVTDPVLAGRADLCLGARLAEPGAWPMARAARQPGARVRAAAPDRRGPDAISGPMRAARPGRAARTRPARSRLRLAAGDGAPRRRRGLAHRRGRRCLPAAVSGTLQGDRQCPWDRAGDPGHGRPGRRG